MSQHTQLPWKLVEGRIQHESKDGVIHNIAWTHRDGGSVVEGDDGRFIVEACNNYDTCLGLLRQLQDALPSAHKVNEIETFLNQRGVR